MVSTWGAGGARGLCTKSRELYLKLYGGRTGRRTGRVAAAEEEEEEAAKVMNDLILVCAWDEGFVILWKIRLILWLFYEEEEEDNADGD